jgi:hypothetical protein
MVPDLRLMGPSRTDAILDPLAAALRHHLFRRLR